SLIGPDLFRSDDVDRAECRRLDSDADGSGDAAERRSRLRQIEWQSAAQQSRRLEPAQDQIRIRYRRLLAAESIARRAGMRAGAHRADFHQAVAIDPCNRAAAGADGIDVDHPK